MKTCTKCIYYDKCSKSINPKNLNLSRARKCTRYAWIGDGTIYKAHDGMRPKGKRPMTLMELIANQKRRDAHV